MIDLHNVRAGADQTTAVLVYAVSELADRVARLEWEHEFSPHTVDKVLAEYGLIDSEASAAVVKIHERPTSEGD